MTVGTGVGHNCGMDKSGYIVIEIDGLHHEHCTTNRLDNPGDDFEEGTKYILLPKSNNFL